MLIKALEHADEKQQEELNRWLNAETFQPAEKIKAVTEIYNQLNIRNVCENKMREYYNPCYGKPGCSRRCRRQEKRIEESCEIINVS